MKKRLRCLSRSVDAPTLLVLLPGAHMTPEHFLENGFLGAVDRRRLALDLMVVDLDLDAVSEGSTLTAIYHDVLVPARARYGKVWLGGVSLGGLLALCQAADVPDSADGLCLLAPYPGSRLTTSAIARAGGLDQWQPARSELDDPEIRVWHWLRRPPASLPVFIGYGRDDRFAAGIGQIADCFPNAARCELPGGHDWPVWRDLWEHFLDLGHFPERADASQRGGA